MAATLFCEKGYAGTSIRDIVKKARIEPSALYYHYESKEALLDAVLDRSVQTVQAEVRAAVEQLPAAVSARERIAVAASAHLRAISVSGGVVLASRRVIGEIPPAAKRKHDAVRAGYVAFWEGLFAQAAAAGEVRDGVSLGIARMYLLGALNWSIEWYDAKKKPPEELAAAFCSLLFEGIG